MIWYSILDFYGKRLYVNNFALTFEERKCPLKVRQNNWHFIKIALVDVKVILLDI